MCTTLKVEIRDYCGPAEDCAVPDLQTGVVNVWTRTLQNSTPDGAGCYELLSADEQERAARYRIERPRNDFVQTRCALRILLARYLGTTPRDLTFEYTEYGKPLLNETCDVRFNVSHTDGLALLAFAKKREIGIDVEKIRPRPDARKLADRFFSVQERRSLENLSGDELQAAFFRCWTRKEAYIKAKGEGLSLPLHQFDVSVAADEPEALLATRPDPSEAKRWSVCALPTSPGYAAALAVAEAETTEAAAVRITTRCGTRAQN